MAVFVVLAALAAPASAQRGREFGLQTVATFARADLGAGGVYGALRVGDRGRLSLSGMVGNSDHRAVFRGELLGHFLLRPRATSGVGAYAFGGAALVAGIEERGYLVVGLGLEARPGGNAGWALEAGVGGGLRVAAGYRWRWRVIPPKG